MNILGKKKEEDKKKDEFFLTLALKTFIFVCLVQLLWPVAGTIIDYCWPDSWGHPESFFEGKPVPFGLFEVWTMGKGSTWEGVKASWPIFIWAGGLTLLVSALTRNARKVNRDAEAIIVEGTVISVMAGLTEEIAFRWWFFYGEIIGLKFISFITCGLVGWLVVNIPLPIADFFTPEAMDPYYYGFGWAVGGAILGSNGKFRDGHLYLGWFGYINSWVIGMFLFWLMFNYGLLAAILSHFIYDQLIFTVKYIDACVERKLGWV